mmetsp:Transcript_168400/g.541027  ORF Transcript_168400/g.541027 Transcript_168400/m.541027 type:complete len:214 (+) Transcript_168400:863-1504(+)
MATNQKEGRNLSREDGQVDEDQPVHGHGTHREDRVAVLEIRRTARFAGDVAILRRPLFRIGTPKHRLVGKHHAQQHQQRETDNVVHVLLPVGDGFLRLVDAGALLLEGSDGLLDFFRDRLLELLKCLFHLLVVDLSIAISVDLLDDSSHGIAAPDPDAVEVERGQAAHTHAVVEDSPAENHPIVVRLFWHIPGRPHLLRHDEDTETEHVPHSG